MNCPACTSKMEIAKKNGIELDVCSNCGKIWFDAGELRKLFPEPNSTFSKLEKRIKDSKGENLVICTSCGKKSYEQKWIVSKSYGVCHDCRGILITSSEVKASMVGFKNWNFSNRFSIFESIGDQVFYHGMQAVIETVLDSLDF